MDHKWSEFLNFLIFMVASAFYRFTYIETIQVKTIPQYTNNNNANVDNTSLKL